MKLPSNRFNLSFDARVCFLSLTIREHTKLFSKRSFILYVTRSWSWIVLLYLKCSTRPYLVTNYTRTEFPTLCHFIGNPETLEHISIHFSRNDIVDLKKKKKLSIVINFRVDLSSEFLLFYKISRSSPSASKILCSMNKTINSNHENLWKIVIKNSRYFANVYPQRNGSIIGGDLIRFTGEKYFP